MLAVEVEESAGVKAGKTRKGIVGSCPLPMMDDADCGEIIDGKAFGCNAYAPVGIFGSVEDSLVEQTYPVDDFAAKHLARSDEI